MLSSIYVCIYVNIGLLLAQYHNTFWTRFILPLLQDKCVQSTCSKKCLWYFSCNKNDSSHSYFKTFWPHKGRKIVYVTGSLYEFLRNLCWFWCISIQIYSTLPNLCKNQVQKPFPWMRTKCQDLGVFSYFPNYSIIVAGISRLMQKIQLCSVYEVRGYPIVQTDSDR